MQKLKKQQGFTLIEMIVSLGVFSVVVTTAVGALLVLIATNKNLQAEQSVMTNLSFALDSMTREIRTGTHYFCETRNNYSAGGPNNIFDSGNDPDAILGNSTQDCEDGNDMGRQLHGVSFKEGGNSITQNAERITYFFDDTAGKIFRRVGGAAPESIVSSGIYIRDMQMYVTGSNPLSAGVAEQAQATVTIFIEAVESNAPTSKPYYIQTTVTQRTLDI